MAGRLRDSVGCWTRVGVEPPSPGRGLGYFVAEFRLERREISVRLGLGSFFRAGEFFGGSLRVEGAAGVGASCPGTPVDGASRSNGEL